MDFTSSSKLLFLYELESCLHNFNYSFYYCRLFCFDKNDEAVFEKIGYKKLKENNEITLQSIQKERLLRVINYIQEIMNKILSTNES